MYTRLTTMPLINELLPHLADSNDPLEAIEIFCKNKRQNNSRDSDPDFLIGRNRLQSGLRLMIDTEYFDDSTNNDESKEKMTDPNELFFRLTCIELRLASFIRTATEGRGADDFTVSQLRSLHKLQEKIQRDGTQRVREAIGDDESTTPRFLQLAKLLELSPKEARAFAFLFALSSDHAVGTNDSILYASNPANVRLFYLATLAGMTSKEAHHFADPNRQQHFKSRVFTIISCKPVMVVDSEVLG
eukprot:TRINITY_DN66377_c2_g8_i1.p1 TRINITY_DN66377_c2_g8~~TRINITY_DN66377_c2_g8_i1.p1  ORF type:complete len:245 (-),score=15.16 TRINITY_DN66377_c2_g8_i1:430-1164(-)